MANLWQHQRRKKRKTVLCHRKKKSVKDISDITSSLSSAVDVNVDVDVNVGVVALVNVAARVATLKQLDQSS